METEDIKKKIDNLYDIIKNTENEVKEIRENCKHIESDISNVGTAPSFELKIVCKICGEVLGTPSPEEVKKAGYV